MLTMPIFMTKLIFQ